MNKKIICGLALCLWCNLFGMKPEENPKKQLYDAIEKNNIETVENILKKNEGIANMPISQDYFSPLIYAISRYAISRHVITKTREVIELLLKYKADPNIHLYSREGDKEEFKRIVRYLNVFKLSMPIINLLLKYGADAEIKNKNDERLLDLFGDNLNKSANWLVDYWKKKNAEKATIENLMALIEADDVEEVSKILQNNKALVNTVDKELNLAPIMLAAKNGNLRMIKLLKENGADVEMEIKGQTSLQIYRIWTSAMNYADEIIKLLTGRNPSEILRTAIQSHDNKNVVAALQRSAVKKIVNTSVDIKENIRHGTNSLDIELTPLMFAINDIDPKETDQIAIIKTLIFNNAQIDKIIQQDKTKLTALLLAIEKENTNVVELLLNNHASANTGNLFGYSPLTLAGFKKLERVINLLIQHGANPESIDANGKSLLDIIEESSNPHIQHLISHKKSSDSYKLDPKKVTVDDFKHFIWHGDLEIVTQILNGHQDWANCNYSNNETPLLIAIENKQPKIVALLLKSGADPNTGHLNGHNALTLALEKKQLEIINLLFKYNASPTDKNKAGKSLLDLYQDNQGILMRLIKYRITKNNVNSATLFDLVLFISLEDMTEVIKILDKHPQLINHDLPEYGTPLLAAVDVNNIDLVRLLINKGANVNQMCCAGMVPLHKAAMRVNSDIINLLTTNGAKTHVKNALQQTPLALYQNHNGNDDNITRLLSSGEKTSEADTKYALSQMLKSGSLGLSPLLWFRLIRIKSPKIDRALPQSMATKRLKSLLKTYGNAEGKLLQMFWEYQKTQLKYGAGWVKDKSSQILKNAWTKAKILLRQGRSTE